MYDLYAWQYRAILLFCVLVGLLPVLTYAGAGHDHGHDHDHETEAHEDASTIATSRLVMVSKHFELVGILHESKTQMQIYLDDYASNAPVSDASLEIELNGEQLTAKVQSAGSYQLHLTHALKWGEYPVLATILTQNNADLLTGVLHLHPSEEKEKLQALAHESSPWWLQTNALALMALGLVLFLLLGLITLRHDWKTREQSQ